MYNVPVKLVNDQIFNWDTIMVMGVAIYLQSLGMPNVDKAPVQGKVISNICLEGRMVKPIDQ